jgi:vancomycin resistance protein VanJ
VRAGARRRSPAVSALVAVATTLAYLSLVPSLAWYAAYLALADDTWWMFLANSVAHFLFVPVVLVLVGGWVFRRRGLVLAASLPTVIAVLLFGGLFVPLPMRSWWPGASAGAVRAPPADAERIEVMTFNLHGENSDVEGVLEAILAADADVVALQEVGDSLGARLLTRVQDAYPYSIISANAGWGGMAILSRFPLTPGSGWLETITRGNPQVVLLHTPFGDVDVVNLHNPSLSRDASLWPSEIPQSIAKREAVSRSLVAFAQASNRPLLVMGDFNATERSVAYRILADELRDAWREGGFGLGSTFPGGPRSPTPYDLRLPWWLIRIDFVFHDDSFVAERARIGQWDGDSDHRPVVVTLAWTGGE